MLPQVVLDTNVLVSALRSRKGASYRLISLIGEGHFETHVSVPLVMEYEDVLQRQVPVPGLTRQDVSDFLDYICAASKRHEVFFLWRPLLKDPADEMVLELAVKARCTFIITYNLRDFEGVERFGICATTPGDFLNRIGILK